MTDTADPRPRIVLDLARGRWPGARALGLPAALRAAPRLARRLKAGRLTLELPDGRRIEIRGVDPGPSATLILRRARAVRRFVLGGHLAFGEAYVDGDWDSPDVAELLAYFLANQREFGLEGGWLPRQAERLRHLLNRNSRRGAKRNIAAHYDLGNAFYQAWLDPGLTYSSALFAGTEDLAAAQTEKYRAIARMADLRPDLRVLEIGCGWGGFAELAAREFGVRVEGITLSRAQLAHAEARIAAAGLADRVALRFQDYRDLDGTYDRIVSIEMIEAVGEAYWPSYFRQLRDRLAPGGIAALQAILIEDRRFPRYRRSPDFIQRHVFPGGMLPCAAALKAEAARVGLVWEEDRGFGQDYARTLRIWAERFDAAWPEIAGLGFDDTFRRLWSYYLAYCEAGFRQGVIDVRQIRLVRPA